jgi:hypothetical protein
MSRLCYLATAAAMFSSVPAFAQSAEETVNVGLTVNIDIGQAAISGLEDVSLNVTTLPDPPSTGNTSDFQTFCLYTPTQFFSMTATGASNGANTEFHLVDPAQSDTSLSTIRYDISITAVLSGHGFGSISNGVARTGIDSALFNGDATCTGGENLELQIFVANNSEQAGKPLDNGEILVAIADGQPHIYTDQLTLLVEPEI